MAPALTGVRPAMARINVDLPEPLCPITPMLSFSWAVNDTPWSARTLRLRSPDVRLEPPLSGERARLPVARTWYSTWASSAMTAGRCSVGPRLTDDSDCSAIALLGGPEEYDADDQQRHRPSDDV